MITVSQNNVFHLQTENTSYLFRVMQSGQLEALYYGRKASLGTRGDRSGRSRQYDTRRASRWRVVLRNRGCGYCDCHQPIYRRCRTDYILPLPQLKSFAPYGHGPRYTLADTRMRQRLVRAYVEHFNVFCKQYCRKTDTPYRASAL